MSSFKKINASDVYQNTIVSNRQWSFSFNDTGNDTYDDTNISVYKGIKDSSSFDLNNSTYNFVYKKLEYNKINQLFYHRYSDPTLSDFNDRLKSLN